MVYTWLRYKKPDVGMTLNAALAGLVAITAGCDAVSPAGAAAIGIAAGLVLPVSVNFFDSVLKIDDPVGAISVHGVCGAMGTILTGFFSTSEGLLYGHGARFLGIQCLGVLATAAWAAVMITIVFLVIKHTIGLRVSMEEELKGLDITEHGLPSAYGGFAFVYDDTPDGLPVTVSGGIPVQEAVPVEVASPAVPQPVLKDGVKLTKVDILCKMERFDALKRAMFDIGITGMTAANVMGCGEQRGKTEGYFRGAKVEATMLPIIQVSIVVSRSNGRRLPARVLTADFPEKPAPSRLPGGGRLCSGLSGVPLKKPEGHGPDAPGGQDHQEVPDGVGGGVAAAEGQQGSLQEAFDEDDQDQPAQQFDGLSPPGGAGGELEEPVVKNADQEHPAHGSGHGVGIFERLGQVSGVHAGGEGKELHETGKSEAAPQQDAQDDVDPVREPQGALHQGVHDENQHRGHDEGDAHVRRGMDAQIHSGDGHEKQDRDAGEAQPELSGDPGHAAEEAHRRLGVAAGEAVACGLRPGGLDDGEIGVFHPGPGDPADHFEPLVHQHAYEAHAEQVVALPLVHAPEDEQRSHHEEGFFSQVGDQGHEDVQDRVADGFKPIEQFHFASSLPEISYLHYNTPIGRKARRKGGACAPPPGRLRKGLPYRRAAAAERPILPFPPSPSGIGRSSRRTSGR